MICRSSWRSSLQAAALRSGTFTSPLKSCLRPYAAPILTLDSGNDNTFTIMKIDIFNHVMPVPYLDMMKQHLKDQGILKRMSNLRMLWDIEARVRMLDEKFPDVQQVLTLSLPSPELVGGPELAPELARIANDGMAGMTAKWPKKFPAFVASLPMNNVPAALEEMDRALGRSEEHTSELQSQSKLVCRLLLEK